MQMAFSNSMSFLAVLLIALPAAFAWDWPTNSSIGAQICDQIQCGKGTCKADLTKPLGYTCECDANWKRTKEGDDDLQFLPCVIPNCSQNYNCQPAPPPVPQTDVPNNISAFNPCYYAYCGEGTCVQNSTYLYTPVCNCNSNAYNLLGIKAFPCYYECALQSDCESLGIKVGNSNSSPDNSEATSFLPGKFQLMAVVLLSLGLILRK